MTNAFHSSSQQRRSSTWASRAGIVVTLEDGTAVYFAGDTCVFGDMQLIGRLYGPSVAVLPIGDHYTMGPREAARRARAPRREALRAVPLGHVPAAHRDARRRCASSRRPASRSWTSSPEGTSRAVRERWLGATGRKVPEIAVEGELELPAEALVLDAVDVEALERAHARGQARRRAREHGRGREARRSPGPRSPACSSRPPSARSSTSTSGSSRMAEPIVATYSIVACDLGRGPVGRRRPVEVPRRRLGRPLGRAARGRDRDAVVREPALRAGRARAAPRRGSRPRRSSSG